MTLRKDEVIRVSLNADKATSGTTGVAASDLSVDLSPGVWHVRMNLGYTLTSSSSLYGAFSLGGTAGVSSGNILYSVDKKNSSTQDTFRALSNNPTSSGTRLTSASGFPLNHLVVEGIIVVSTAGSVVPYIATDGTTVTLTLKSSVSLAEYRNVNL